MSKTIPALVKVDLTPIKKGVVDCDASIGLDSLDRPETITVVVRGLDATQINTFCNAKLSIKDVFGDGGVSGHLVDGEQFAGKLAFIRGVSFGPAEAHVECFLISTSRSVGAAGKAVGCWVFGLANYRISGVGDESTSLPPPSNSTTPEKIEEWKNALQAYFSRVEKVEYTREQIDAKFKGFTPTGGHRRNRIRFNFAGREWTLDDEMYGRWPEDDSKISEPLRSGILRTAFQTGDTPAQLCQAVDDISVLLSLALGRDIKRVQSEKRDENDAPLEIHYQNPGLLTFNQNGSRFADNWEAGNLKSFLQSGEKVVAADRDWWSVTIGLLTQARGAKHLEVKSSLINTLLDRITTKIVGDAKTPEIDADLDAKLKVKEFRVTLHFVLSTLTPNWDTNRTEAICNKIKEWNAGPSFSKKIIRACQSLGISPVSGKKLGFRHVLIHEGEMHGDLKTIEERAQYYFELEMLVLLLLVRRLKFDGLIYIQSVPPDPNPKKVSEFLA